MSDSVVYLDNSVALQSSLYNLDASNMTISGTLSSDNIDVRNTITNMQTVLAQIIFRDAVKKHEEKFEKFNDEQMLELMKSFAYEIWHFHPCFQKLYAMFDETTMKCKICFDENEAKQSTLEGFCDYFTFLY